MDTAKIQKIETGRAQRAFIVETDKLHATIVQSLKGNREWAVDVMHKVTRAHKIRGRHFCSAQADKILNHFFNINTVQVCKTY